VRIHLMEAFRPGTAASGASASRVELAISCKDLMDADILSKSDPMCVLSIKVCCIYVMIFSSTFCRNSPPDDTLNMDVRR
jgi:hypothetical protein